MEAVMDGWLYGVLRTGPYRGHLVVGQQPNRSAVAAGVGNPVSVVSPNGEVVLHLPDGGREAAERTVAEWLKEKGWLL